MADEIPAWVHEQIEFARRIARTYPVETDGDHAAEFHALCWLADRVDALTRERDDAREAAHALADEARGIAQARTDELGARITRVVALTRRLGGPTDGR